MSVMSPDQLLNSTTNPTAPLALTGTQYTRPLMLNGASRASFQLFQVGTITAAVTLWGTNVPAFRRNDATDADWTDFSAAPHSITVPNQPAGADSKSMTMVSDVCCHELRLKIVTASGAGTGTCWGKVIE